jgi:poly(A) polymerase
MAESRRRRVRSRRATGDGSGRGEDVLEAPRSISDLPHAEPDYAEARWSEESFDRAAPSSPPARSPRSAQSRSARPIPAQQGPAQQRADQGRAPSLLPPNLQGDPPRRYNVEFGDGQIDPDVVRVLRRLVQAGYEAYLVGGCVRDLLLGRQPKDFDVGTSARPEEVRAIFRNSRIIGRRFRLVHILFGQGKFFEVATFRRNPRDLDVDEEVSPDSEDLLIRDDNVFGDTHEDVMRRDFTINALFYDETRREVLDWVGGMQDLERNMLETIGAPETRFREDPVRILRAIKFAGRLGFGIAPDVYDAVVSTRELLLQAARPRVSEEILRLMRGGQARRTLFLAWETGILDVLLPELGAQLTDCQEPDGAAHRFGRLMEYVDDLSRAERPVDDATLWTLLLLEPLLERLEGERDRSHIIQDTLEPIAQSLAIPPPLSGRRPPHRDGTSEDGSRAHAEAR